jgi:hypothetical protein
MARPILTMDNGGPRGPNEARTSIVERRLRRDSVPTDITGRAVIVHRYHADVQKVDVIYKDAPYSQVIRGVPILDAASGSMGRIRRIHSITQDGIENADVGYILWPDVDHTQLLVDRFPVLRTFTQAASRASSRVPFFLGTLPLATDGPPSTIWDEADVDGTDSEVLGPNDEAFIFANGAMLVAKANGDVVLHAVGDFIVKEVI